MLNIAIAGAGLTGLTTALLLARTGHTVNVYERKTEELFANEGGAGVQLQPNATRVLDAWGIDISAIGHNSGGVVMRRYSNGEALGHVAPLAGYQMYCLRSDYRRDMLARVSAEGVRVHFDTDIVGVDASRPALLLNGGGEIKADLIIAADGIRSRVRQSLFPSVQIEARPDCTFQLQVPFSDLKSEAAKQALNNPTLSIVYGPGSGIVISPIPSRQILDMQFVSFDYGLEEDSNPEKWYEFIPSVDHLRKRYKDFGGIVPEALSVGTGTWKWRLAECAAPDLVSDNGRVILSGDAAHAMVPHAGQGAGMCIEDAAVLAELLRNVSAGEDSQFEALGRIYQGLRKPRTDRCRRRAQHMGMAWSLPDGAMQQKRDASFRHAMESKMRKPLKGLSESNPLSHEFDNWLEQYDAIEDARDALRKAGLGASAPRL